MHEQDILYISPLGNTIHAGEKILMKKTVIALSLITAAIFAGTLAGCSVRDSVDQSSDYATPELPESQNPQTLPENTAADVSSPDAGINSESETPSETESESAEPFVDKLTPEALGWGLSFGESGTQPAGNASPEELKQYDAYFMGNADENVIYLTFDCGYENGNTEPILDALKKHDAPATFFVVGHYLETEPDLVKRMAEDGHTVGSHTYHHPDVNTLPDLSAFQKEMDDVAELYTQITGEQLAMYYRPPEGKCGITNLEMAQELGYSTILWSLAYVDWDADHQPGHKEALEKLTARIHPGAVVLLHNTSQTNGEILDELLTAWEDMGYSFMPLSDLTEEKTSSIK